MEAAVEGAVGEDALGADEAEDDRGIEEDAAVGAGEVVCLAGLADVFYVAEGSFHDCELHDPRPERGDYLSEEGYALGDLEVEAEF